MSDIPGKFDWDKPVSEEVVHPVGEVFHPAGEVVKPVDKVFHPIKKNVAKPAKKHVAKPTKKVKRQPAKPKVEILGVSGVIGGVAGSMEPSEGHVVIWGKVGSKRVEAPFDVHALFLLPDVPTRQQFVAQQFLSMSKLDPAGSGVPPAGLELMGVVKLED